MDPSFDQNAQSFDAADNAAFAAISEMNKADSTPSVQQVAESAQAAVTPQTPSTPAQTPLAAEPTTATLKDDDLVEVMVGGQPQKLAWKDARNSVMMHADYTRKTQEVASARKELESIYSQLQERETKILSFLQDPTQVETYLNKIRNAQVAENPNISPNELVSHADVRNLLQQEIAAAKTQMEQTFQAKVQELEVTRAATGIRSDLDTTVDALKGEFPSLKAIPGVEKILYDEVNKMNPSTTAEAKQYFATVAKAMVSELDKHYTNQQKQSAVQKQNLVKQGIEPSGVGVLPKAVKHKTFAAAEDDVIAQISALMKG